MEDQKSTPHKAELKPVEAKSNNLSITIPKPSMPGFQSLILILLIVVGVTQAVQLYGLQKNIANAKVNTSAPAVSSTSTGTSSSSGSSALPTMVGGC